MRILHLINHCRFGHGNVHAAIDLACAQVDRGDVPIIASGDGEYRPLLQERKVEHVILPQESRKPFDVLVMIARVYALARSARPDVIHAHMMTGAVVGWVVSKLTGVKLVTTVHNAFDGHSVLMGLGDRIICVSAAVADIMVNRRRLPRRKMRTVLNGTLNAPRRDYFGREPIALIRPSVATLCGLHDRKGVRDLIRAFDILARTHAEVQLYIVGDGPHRPDYEALAASLESAGRIHFPGKRRDTKTVLEQVDVFVLASYEEPFGLVIPEAREAGCAVIGTRVDGIPEALEQGAAGLLVSPGAPDELAAVLIALFSDPARLQAQKAAGQQNMAYWDIARMADDTAAVYAELVPPGRA